MGNKKFFIIFFISFTILFLFSEVQQAQGVLVPPCGVGQPIYIIGGNAVINPTWRRCELADIFVLVLNVYNFIIWTIVTPLAGLLIVIGGILIMVSGGGQTPIPGIAASPNLYSTGRRMISGAVLGVFLAWLSWLIVNFVLLAIGYTSPTPWWNPF